MVYEGTRGDNFLEKLDSLSCFSRIWVYNSYLDPVISVVASMINLSIQDKKFILYF